MSKNYLCKDCDFNNNGWCNKRNIQGLKNITECKFKSCLSIEDSYDLEQEFDVAPYKQFGKREMFRNIQMQIIGIEDDIDIEDKLKALKQVMVNLEDILRVEEKIHGIALEYMIDDDIYKSSMKISEKWFKEVGRYEDLRMNK